MRPLVVLVLVTACTTSAPASPPETAREPTSPPTAQVRGSPSAPVWRTFAPITTPRSEVAAAVGGSKIYVLGGFGGQRVVERYDPAGDRWERVADLPIGVNHALAAAVDDVVYLFGGYLESGGTSDRVFRYDAVSNAWREVARMPEARGAGAAASVGGQVVIAGGARDGRLLATAQAYDPRQDRWRRVADLPAPRDHLAMAPFREEVCAVGGRRLSMAQNLGTTECYDPRADRWRKAPDMPTRRGGLGAANLIDAIWAVGGEESTRTFKEVEVFDGARWVAHLDLPTPRHGLAVAAFGRTLYVLTGGPTPGGSQTAVVEGLVLP